MHLRFAPLAVALLLGAAAVAVAQTNTNQIQSQVTTFTAKNGTQPTPACPGFNFAAAPGATSLVKSATCSATYAGGTQALQAATSINNGLVSASASLDGTFTALTNANARAVTYAWNFYTISNPASIFRIGLSTTVTTSATVSGNPNDNAYAFGYLEANRIDPITGGAVGALGGVLRSSGAGLNSSSNNQTRTCTRAGACTGVTTASNVISLDLFATDLNSNGAFGAFLEAFAFTSASNSGPTVTEDLDAYAYFTAPTVTLYDIDGNDVTAQHTITQDLVPTPEVVATPEPASVVLLATGLIGVFGVVLRRRKNAA